MCPPSSQDKILYIEQVLKESACLDCGIADRRVLCFHHRDAEGKVANVPTLARRKTATLEAVKAEIAKCDILCFNCHAIRHWEVY